MPLPIQGATGVVLGVGEAASQPAHVTLMPMGGNAYRFSGFTGTIGAALAANSELFQFRFVSSTKSFAVVRSVKVDGFAPIVAATVAGPLGWMLSPARAWTVAGSGGTRISVASNNLKTRTGSDAPQVSDIGIATTGALTAGTKTLDANAQAQVLVGVGTAAVTAWGGVQAGVAPLLVPEQAPLILGNNEGFAIRTTHAGPASLTYAVGFSVEWNEVTAI